MGPWVDQGNDLRPSPVERREGGSEIWGFGQHLGLQKGINMLCGLGAAPATAQWLLDMSGLVIPSMVYHLEWPDSGIAGKC